MLDPTTQPPTIDSAASSIVVNAPVADVYARWLAVEDYPKFVTAIKSVRKINPCRFAVCVALNGYNEKATLEILLRVPERRVAWRTLADNGHAEHFAAVVASFMSCSRDSTSVDLKLTSTLGGAISRRVARYLRKFKTLVESDRFGKNSASC